MPLQLMLGRSQSSNNKKDELERSQRGTLNHSIGVKRLLSIITKLLLMMMKLLLASENVVITK